MTTIPDPTLSQETRATIKLDIDKSLEEDFQVKHYQEQVREYLSDRKLEDVETDANAEWATQEIHITVTE